jgi:hypothetical protein
MDCKGEQVLYIFYECYREHCTNLSDGNEPTDRERKETGTVKISKPDPRATARQLGRVKDWRGVRRKYLSVSAPFV